MNRVEYRIAPLVHNRYGPRCQILFGSTEKQLKEFCSLSGYHIDHSGYRFPSLHPQAVTLRQPHIPGTGIHKLAW